MCKIVEIGTYCTELHELTSTALKLNLRGAICHGPSPKNLQMFFRHHLIYSQPLRTLNFCPNFAINF